MPSKITNDAGAPKSWPAFNVAPVSRRLMAQARQKIDQKTKPIGALGRLEGLALQLVLVQDELSPCLRHPAIVVFAADHGITAEGVSPYPSEVTAQMVQNFLSGGAAINVFAALNGLQLKVVDAGMLDELPGAGVLDRRRVGAGTRNFLHEPAMTQAQCAIALAHGVEVSQRLADAGSNVVGFGEMGIGNTSAAALVMSLLLDLPVRECVGAGTGLDDAGILHKCGVLERARARIVSECPAALGPGDPAAVMRQAGGFEMVMMAGAMLAAAERGLLILVDGFIATAALLAAASMHRAVTDYCVFSHCSNEHGHQRMLEHFDAEPLLDLGLRLGEGTGAALAYPLVQAAAAFLRDMASFADAGVAGPSGD